MLINNPIYEGNLGIEINPKPKKVKKPKNRKHISYKEIYKFEGHEYKVNSKPSGLYTPILKRTAELTDGAIEQWGRVLLIRFDLHHVNMLTLDSSHISKFTKNLVRKLERKYNHKIKYIWVRELGGKNGGQHYHFVLLLNGNRVNKSRHILEITKNTWKGIDNHFNLSIPKNCYYFIDNQDVMNEAIWRVSYLAKVGTKGCRPLRAKDYGSNQLKRIIDIK